ncbi:hypothetical protein H0H92_000288, partial [Tricholoma furcatifolium]
IELVEAQALQYEACDATVFFEGLREDENVIEVHAHHALGDEVAKDVVHHGLEGGGAIGEAEEHDERLE